MPLSRRASLLLLLAASTPVASFVASLAMATPAFAADRDHQLLADAFALFSKGAYSQAIAKARQISSPALRAERAFFLGTAEAKLQAYDEAATDFAAALAAGSKEPSLPYDYGQALFATQKLPRRRPNSSDPSSGISSWAHPPTISPIFAPCAPTNRVRAISTTASASSVPTPTR